MSIPSSKNIRYIAIIAHVAHDKTTIIDSIFRKSNNFRDSQLRGERITDINTIEKERGIIIQNVLHYDCTINIIDTPWHADFGGEVELVLCIVDSCLLLVDSAEGVIPQTNFFLGKALKQGLRRIVVIIKIDKPDQRAKEVLDENLELFMNFEAADEQLDFPVLYSSGRDGWASEDTEQRGGDLKPLLDKIFSFVPAPKDQYNDGEFRFLATMLEQDNFLGRVLAKFIVERKIKPSNSITRFTK